MSEWEAHTEEPLVKNDIFRSYPECVRLCIRAGYTCLLLRICYGVGESKVDQRIEPYGLSVECSQ